MSSGRFSHQRKQLKFLVPGAALTYTFHVVSNLFAIVSSAPDAVPHSTKCAALHDPAPPASSRAFPRLAANLAVLLGALTIALFLYLILVPWIRNVQLDVRYTHWFL